MLQIQLYIETDKDNSTFEQVELFKDESIVLTQSIQDIKNIEKILGDFTRTFSVPASKVNNKIFKHFHNFNIDGFDARSKKNGKLFINYKPYKEGKIKFEAVDLKNNKPHTYKLTFFGNTITFNDTLGDDKLSGLKFLSQLDFDYTDTNIAAFMANGKDVTLFTESIPDALVFPLITSTRRIIYDENTNVVNTATIDNVFPFSGTGVTYGLSMADLKPAIRVYTIIRAVEVQYDIKFSTDFFNNTNPQFYDLYLWLHNKEGRAFVDQNAQYQIKNIGQITGDNIDIKGFSSNSFVSSFDEANRDQSVRVNVKPSGSASYNLVIKRNGEEFNRYDNLTGTTTNGSSPNKDVINLPISNGTYTFFIETIVASTYNVDITINQNIDNTKKLDHTITAKTANAEFTGDIQANISSLIPDMQVKDFISGLFKMFNLTAFVNSSKEIVVQNLDDFYASSTKVWDITQDIDATQKTVQTVLPFKDIKFTYKGLGSFLSVNHLEIANKEWGELKTKNRSNGEIFNGTDYTIELPFEHFKFEHLFQLDNGSINQTNGKDDLSGVQYGYSVDKSQSPYLGDPLLFYVDKSPSNISVVNRAGNARQIIIKPYMPLNSNSITWTDDIPAPSINFNAEMSEYQLKPSTETLFKQYYKSYIEDIFNKRRRLTTVKAFLPITMISKLNLADQIIMFDNLYRINKIVTNFETNESTLELNNIFVQQVFKTLVKVATNNITIDTDTITIDSVNILADAGGATDFVLPNLIEPNPTPKNEPVDQLFNKKLISIAPAISSILANPSTATSVGMAFKFGTDVSVSGNLGGLGKLGETFQVEEYGFIYSTSSIDLNSSNDIDVLAAISGVTKLNYNPVDTHIIPGDNGNIYFTLTGLTNPAEIFYRFYARTTIDPLQTKADAISLPVITRTTAAATTTFFNAADQFLSDIVSPTIRFNAHEVKLFSSGIVKPNGQTGSGSVIAGQGRFDQMTEETAIKIVQWFTSQDVVEINTYYTVKTKAKFVSGDRFYNWTGTSNLGDIRYRIFNTGDLGIEWVNQSSVSANINPVVAGQNRWAILSGAAGDFISKGQI